MALNFPDTPTIGEIYSTYVWDGQKWQPNEGSVEGGSIGDAPVNSMIYGRKDALWVQTIKRAGDSMTGPLDLPAAPAPVAANAVRKDYVDSAITTLDTSLRAYAAPLDALAYNGMQINGAMDVNQLGVGSTVNGYVCDGWAFFGGAVGLGFVAATYPADGTTPAGFAKFLGIGISTPVPSPAADAYAVLQQPIEGYRISRLAWGTASAKPLTLGFWTAHHRTGTYSVGVKLSNQRSYLTTYTQNAADVPEFKTVTIPGDTAGIWPKDNTAGLTISFALVGGTTFGAPTANTWLAGHYFNAPGQVNALAATSDLFRITGLVVLPGISAPTAAQSPLIMRPYNQELLTCQRYFQVFGGGHLSEVAANAQAYNTTGALATVWLRPTMRSGPTFSYVGGWVLTAANTSVLAISSITLNTASPRSASLNCIVSAGLVSGNVSMLYPNNSLGSLLHFDARL